MSLRTRKLAGTLVHYGAQFLSRSLRRNHFFHPEYNPETAYLFAFWHGQQFLPVLDLISHQTARATLVSPSKDGDYLAAWLNKIGYEVIRGSSRKDNIKALQGMMKKLKLGYSLGFGVDGPIGPIHKIKPGILHMAAKYNIEIVPVGSAFSKYWEFSKAWDKYQLPKPFAKATLYLDKPVSIEKLDSFEALQLEIEAKITAANKKAAALL